MTNVKPTHVWRKSSYSGLENDCVEVAITAADPVPVRDSKSVPGPVVAFPRRSWDSFLSSVRGGEFA